MTATAVTRKLRAIAFMDVAGYSRLMARDEAGTHARVNQIFGSIVPPIVSACGGRVVDRAGDGLLVEFQSSTDAVRCAVEIQRQMALQNADRDPEQRFELRIGVNIGDIIVDGDRIVGDGVNIAARLENIAAPGGICISGSVREQLHEDFDATITDLGELRLKNIGRPIRAFQMLQGSVRRRGRFGLLWPAYLNGATARWPFYVVGMVAVMVAAGFGVVAVSDRNTVDPPPMSVVVVPFSAKNHSVEQPAADAVTREVTRGLAATTWLQVTAPNVASQVPVAAQNVGAIGRQFNVRYLVFGRIEQRNGKLGLDAQLIDAARGVTAWNAYVDSGVTPATESELALRLVVLLRDAVYEAEAKRLLSSGAKPSTPMEFKIFGDQATDPRFVTLASDRAAREYYEKALKVDPNFVPAMISIGYTLLTELDLDPAVDRASIVQRLDELSKRILGNDSASAPGWQFRAETLARQWRWDAALEASDKALALDPGRALGFGHRAHLMILLGRPAEALALVDKALALADQRFGYALLQRCRAQMALGQYREAVTSCEKSVSREELWLAHAYLAAAYALLGEDDNMKREKAALLQQYPNISIARIAAMRYSDVPQYLRQIEEHLNRGLAKAGIAAS